MLENEMWTRCPVPPSFSVDDVKEFSEGLSAPLLAPTPAPSLQSQINNKAPKTTFDQILANGNPFTQMIQSQRKKAAPAHAAAAAAAAAAWAAQKKGDENDDSDEESAELRADYIDEDGLAIARSQPQRAPVEDKGPLLAPTTLTVVRLLAKYIYLLRVLYKSLGLEVFVAMVQLAEYFIYTVYSLFGSPPPGSGMSHDELAAGMSPALRKMLSRLKERYSHSSTPVLLSAVHGVADSQATKERANASNSPHDLIKIKWSLVRPTPAQASELSSTKVGIGMGMRTVGTESLLFLADALLKARNVLQSMMPPTATEFFSVFYKNITLIPELRTNMYKAAASALFMTESIGRAVESVKWDTPVVRYPLLALLYLSPSPPCFTSLPSPPLSPSPSLPSPSLSLTLLLSLSPPIK